MMETITAEYITCVIEAAMTMFFCLYVTRGLLQAPMRILAPVAALLAVAGSAASMALSAWLSACLPFSMDTSTVSLPLWFAVGYFSLRRATHERAGGLLFILLLSVQVLHLCRSTTYFFYGLFLPHMTDGSYCWADIPGFGIPSVVLTFLLAVFCRRLYQKLRGIDLRGYLRLWLIPLFFVILYILQTNIYPLGNFTLTNGFRLLIGLCAFVTYSQMVSAISHAAMAARETEIHTQLAHQLDLQRARVDDLESHAEEMKRIRHDRRQHVQVLRGLLEKGKVQEALTYLDDYEDSMAGAIQPPLCENFVADTLCRRYETLAKQSDIMVTMNISLPKEPGISGSDLAVILGNLWENAVAAALDAKETHRFIRLRIQTREEQILIRMENGYDGVICQEGERFLSSKPGRNRAEGVGIASIRSMARRYSGLTAFDYTPDTFTASVLLYLPKPGELIPTSTKV